MKLRIKGNTIRFRLTKSEVGYFGKMSEIKEQTDFGSNFFSYSLITFNGNKISASLNNNSIIIAIPRNTADKWINSNAVGMSEEIEIEGNKKLFILIEKDFKCLDETSEDQSDNYENPLSAKTK